MPESRTRARALAELVRLLPEVRAEITDARLRPLLSEALVRQLFDHAWDHQFDNDRTHVARVLRDIVREAIAGLEPEPV
jgi:hypothetical protein